MLHYAEPQPAEGSENWSWHYVCEDGSVRCGVPPQVVYYIFAMVGMELFKGKVTFYEQSSTDPAKAYCGNPLLNGTDFAKLNYCKNNFNDVVSSFILLVELTVVNQWHDIL